MKTPQMREALLRAGLSRYEALVFLNLAELGAATARELARVTGVNRVQTYRVLDSLEARGLVEVTLDRPKRFASRAVDEVFDVLAEEKRLELEGLEAVRSGVRRALPKISARSARAPIVRLQVIKGPTETYRAIRRVVSGATKEVLAFTTSKGIQRSYRAGINDVLVQAMGRGVKARLIAEVNAGNAALMARVAARVPMRHVVHQSGRFIIADRDSIIAFLVQDETSLRGDAETAMWTNSPDFVRAHVEYFERSWEGAVSANRRLAALRRARSGGQVLSSRAP